MGWLGRLYTYQILLDPMIYEVRETYMLKGIGQFFGEPECIIRPMIKGWEQVLAIVRCGSLAKGSEVYNRYGVHSAQ